MIRVDYRMPSPITNLSIITKRKPIYFFVTGKTKRIGSLMNLPPTPSQEPMTLWYRRHVIYYTIATSVQ